MNRPIRTLSVGCLILFVALMLNLTYVQFFKASWYNDRADNRRVTEEAYAQQRGDILVGKKAIATSKPSDDKYEWQRTYPGGKKYAPITGFMSYSYGQTGIERSQDSVLSGQDNKLFTNRLVDLVTNSEPAGGNVELTIDPKVQDAAYEGLTALGEDVQAATVAIEPKTGRILAMASTPTYNPSKLATHDFGAASKSFNNLSKDEDEPLLNRSIQTALPPGSTFKLVTAAAAIEKLGMDGDSKVYGGASLDLPGTTTDLPNLNGTSCGGEQITLTRALEVSCNTAFGQLGMDLSDEDMRAQAEAFGFGQHYLDDIGPQAKSRYPTNDGKDKQARAAIGQQDVIATPLQMAMVSAGIANGGEVMKPYLVDRVTSSSLDVIDQGKPTTIDNQPAISRDTAEILTQMMVSVVDNGTAEVASIPGVSVAGKTGTAQSSKERAPYAWFTSFAPAENPSIAVAVMVQKSGTERSEIAGGRLGGPIAKAMMEAAIS
ncbi:peptidoglycan glycosyltransferase [Nocardioides luteus]|uniref:Penicillin-binding protein n=1 Tax=Nocardioides luteus TaxID=1844 RepID=A0ABQ5SPM4_9ACTN|nr:penicillin-binding protein 2 [Nocardioides luteus]MDR7313042.1 peptidoglycan glycosyltransferase [Nocardioides luteus]GGR44493.1 penicillin-binding protein [Nocardioides luteus]GLJ66103.1 penicillin-binding protein [Nocardioides luteus]